MTTTHRRTRRFIYSEPGESLDDVARRALGVSGAVSTEEFEQFLSWNLHLSNGIFSHVAQNTTPLLPSEIVYVEPPIPVATT